MCGQPTVHISELLHKFWHYQSFMFKSVTTKTAVTDISKGLNSQK